MSWRWGELTWVTGSVEFRFIEGLSDWTVLCFLLTSFLCSFSLTRSVDFGYPLAERGANMVCLAVFGGALKSILEMLKYWCELGMGLVVYIPWFISVWTYI